MTATLGAQMSLAAVQATLGEQGQWLPMDGEPGAPIGRLVEQNSTGPLRLGYGAWRDLLLGCQFTNGRGEVISAGGRTVKNVAGYDLTKFMVGQGGAFGKIVTITTRTYRRPAGALLAEFEPEPGRLGQWMATALKPSWAILTPEALLCGYLGDARTLEFCAAALPDARPRQIIRRSLDEDIAHRAALWRVEAGGNVVFRASVPPARLAPFIAQAGPVSWVADAAFGIVLGTAEAPPSIASAAKAAGGSAWFFDQDGNPADVASDPVAQTILHRLKEAFGQVDQRVR